MKLPRTRVVLASIAFSLHQACEALVPIAVGITIDAAIASSDPWRLAASLAALALVFTVLLWVWRLGELSATRAFVETTYAVRGSLVARLLAPRSSFAGRPAQALSTLSSDVDEAASVVWTVSHAIAAGAAVVTASIALLLISPPLAALVLLGTPILMLGLHYATRPLERRSAAEQSALADSSALAGDLLSGLRTVKGLSAEAESMRRFRAVNSQSLRTALRSATAEGAFAGVSSLISGLYLVLLAAIAAAAVVRGELSAGQLVTVIGLAQFLQWPVAGLGFVGAQLARARASSRRVRDLAAAPTGPGDELPPGPGAVTIDRLRLPSGRELTLDIPAGELLGVVLDEADAIALGQEFAGRGDRAGTIRIDGHALVGPPAAGRPPAVVAPPHEAVLYTGSLEQNVFPPDSDHTPAHISAMTDAAFLHDVVAVSGWSRDVGERGRLLSGGQRQRVALARALARDPAVLVLREPATSVDAMTQAGLARGLRQQRIGRTTLLLTTSPALLSVCDRVIRMTACDEGGVHPAGRRLSA